MGRDCIAPIIMKIEKQMEYPHDFKKNNGRICKP